MAQSADLKTGLTPSATGSAYLEIEQQQTPRARSLASSSHQSSLKLACTVHGPRPIPRSAAFSPNMLLSTHIKFAPFATFRRMGHVRTATERDLAVHLEAALRGAILTDRSPKSGVDVIVTVLEGEAGMYVEDSATLDSSLSQLGIVSILSGCITVASAAMINAGIDCVDIVSGGVSAIVQQPSMKTDADSRDGAHEMVLDPCPLEHGQSVAVCVVAYLKSRDEVTEVWINGSMPASLKFKEDGPLGIEMLVDGAVQAASATQLVIVGAMKD